MVSNYLRMVLYAANGARKLFIRWNVSAHFYLSHFSWFRGSKVS